VVGEEGVLMSNTGTTPSRPGLDSCKETTREKEIPAELGTERNKLDRNWRGGYFGRGGTRCRCRTALGQGPPHKEIEHPFVTSTILKKA